MISMKISRSIRYPSLLLPLLFLSALLLLYRPGLLAASPEISVQILSNGSYALLAGAFLALLWDKLGAAVAVLSRAERAALVILAVSGLAHFLWNGFLLPEYLGQNLFYVTIPLFAMACRERMIQLLPPFFVVLWLINTALCMYLHATGYAHFGLAGNWNWSGTLTVISTPFVFLLLQRYFRSRLLGEGLSAFLSVLILAVPFLFLIYNSQSLGAWVVLAAGGIVLILSRLPLKFRKIVVRGGIALLLLSLVLFLFAGRGILEREIRSETRPSLWRFSLTMIADHPFGVGAERLEEALGAYKSDAYFRTDNAAVRSPHPHNELLYLAAALGIPAMLAWLYLTLRAVDRFLVNPDRERRNGKILCLFLAWIMLLVHGMIDLVLFAWPSALLALLLSGIFWGRIRKGEVWISPAFFRWTMFASLFLLFLLTALTSGFGTLWMEQGRRAAGKNPDRAAELALAGGRIAPQCSDQIFETASFLIRLPEVSPNVLKSGLLLLDTFRTSPIPNIGNIHSLRANALARLGRDEEAIAEYRLDLIRYPHLILPRVGILTATARLGRESELPGIRREIAEVMKKRALSESDLEAILRNPSYDMQPHLIRIDRKKKGRSRE